MRTSSSGAVVVSSSALPNGAATSAKQDIGNTSAASIDDKTPALVAGRVPVDGSGVIQPVSGTFWQNTQPVSGTFWQATQPVSGTFWQAVQPVSDVINGAGVEGALSVTNTAAQIKVGASAHAGRKLISLYNNSNVVIYWGWTSSVTTSTGTPIQPQTFNSWPVGPNATVYVIAASGTNDTRITEAAGT